jgi:hypothetical protein
MAVTVKAIIDEIRAETGELAPDKMPDVLLLGWINDDTNGIFLQFIDIFQERFLSSQASAAITWGTSTVQDATITTPVFKAIILTDNAASPVLLMSQTLSQIWGFNGNANYNSNIGWVQINETTFKIAKGSSATGPTVVTVYGVKKPTLATATTDSVNLPDEFVPLVKSKSKIRAFDLLGRMEKVQSEMGKLAERIQGIEQSFRMVTSQATEGKTLGVR